MGMFEDTGIWTRSMETGTERDKDAREKLRSVYRTFWDNAVVLSREIQRDVPNLTLHDDAHFEALWGRADQIAGPGFSLTPLEAFVLGGAILLHDNANSLAAFEGGLDALKATPEWRDAEAEWVGRAGDEAEPQVIPPEAVPHVLFEVLRGLHAERARTLADMAVNAGGKTFYLLPDDQLRTHLGSLIGDIAASHHWDISTLSDRLPSVVGTLAGMPAAWTIRPVLLACLLRCADAVQLDQQRAPDFLYAMLRLRGVSELHWRAQNRLATPVVAPDDPSALIFSSTMPFGADDAEAWWVAHDAIQVANRELQASNSLLRDLRLPPFAVNRVEGALSPAALARHMRVSGWRPVQAEVKITQVDKVVEMFGGEELYGRDLSAALRELIQNASDAIRFRRELEPPTTDYNGSIIIRMKPLSGQSGDVWLEVEDDGLGMSEAVLTGPLIDFGSSYVSSALVKSERPGLLSKGRKRIGKFGIGFFSSFMLGDEVIVTSRPFDAGFDQIRTLHFRQGIGHRPLLLDERPSDLGSNTSTRVRLRMTAERCEELLKMMRGSWEILPLSLTDLVGMLCPMLDADVYVEVGGIRRLVHPRRWMDEGRLLWLRRITGADARKEKNLDENLDAAVPLLTFLDPNDPSAGLACITGAPGAGVKAVGTLKAGMPFNHFSDDFVGAIDHLPDNPRRSYGKPRLNAHLAEWASDQALRNRDIGSPVPRRIYAAERVAQYGGDATPIAMVRLNREWVDLETLLDQLAASGPIYAPLKFDFDKRLMMTVVRERHSGFVDNYRPGELEYLVPTIEVGSDDKVLYAVPTEEYSAENGICMLLTRLALSRGLTVKGEIQERVDFARYVGPASPREGLEPGKLIGCSGLRLWVE